VIPVDIDWPFLSETKSTLSRVSDSRAQKFLEKRQTKRLAGETPSVINWVQFPFSNDSNVTRQLLVFSLYAIVFQTAEIMISPLKSIDRAAAAAVASFPLRVIAVVQWTKVPRVLSFIIISALPLADNVKRFDSWALQSKHTKMLNQ